MRRTADAIASHMDYIDIADRPATEPPDPRGVRYSIYSDASGFMEVEAAGGMPAVLEPLSRVAISVTTGYSLG